MRSPSVSFEVVLGEAREVLVPDIGFNATPVSDTFASSPRVSTCSNSVAELRSLMNGCNTVDIETIDSCLFNTNPK